MLLQGDWPRHEDSGETLKNFKQWSYMAVVWKMDSGKKCDKFGKRETT